MKGRNPRRLKQLERVFNMVHLRCCAQKPHTLHPDVLVERDGRLREAHILPFDPCDVLIKRTRDHTKVRERARFCKRGAPGHRRSTAINPRSWRHRLDDWRNVRGRELWRRRRNGVEHGSWHHVLDVDGSVRHRFWRRRRNRVDHGSWCHTLGDWSWRLTSHPRRTAQEKVIVGASDPSAFRAFAKRSTNLGIGTHPISPQPSKESA